MLTERANDLVALEMGVTTVKFPIVCLYSGVREGTLWGVRMT